MRRYGSDTLQIKQEKRLKRQAGSETERPKMQKGEGLERTHVNSFGRVSIQKRTGPNEVSEPVLDFE